MTHTFKDIDTLKYKFLIVFSSLFPTILYALQPFGPFTMDELMEITHHKWYGPFWYYWIFFAPSVSAFFMCFPARTWARFRWLIPFPFWLITGGMIVYYILIILKALTTIPYSYFSEDALYIKSAYSFNFLFSTIFFFVLLILALLMIRYLNEVGKS